MSVACSPDGKLLATALGDFLGGEILLWNRAKGKVISRLQGHTDTVDSVVFSPNGRILASASWDKTIRDWDVKTGNLKSTFKGCAPIAFSPDGKTLAAGSDFSPSQGIRLWNLNTGKLRSTLKSHNLLYSIAFSPNGKILASGGCDWDKTIELWNPTTGKLKLIYKRPTSLINCVAFSPDGKTLASSSDRNTVHVWEALTGKWKTTFKGQQDCAMSVVFSPDGLTLAFASGKTIELWDVSKFK